MKKNITSIIVSVIMVTSIIFIFPVENVKSAAGKVHNMKSAGVTFHPTNDSFISKLSPDVNFGNWHHLEIRNCYGSGGLNIFQLDVLVSFDISVIPSNSFIVSAELKFYYYNWRNNNPKDRPLNLYRIIGSWDEDTVTWSNQPSYANQPTNYSIIPNYFGWISWDVVNDVQAFINGFYSNYGWKITDETYCGDGNIPIIEIHSKEYGIYIPYLEIEYEFNNPPNKPLATYRQDTDEIVINTEDPNGNQIRYGVSWNNDKNVNQWTGFVDSGTEQKIDCNGRTGTVGVVAEDEFGAQSDWVTVIISKSYIDIIKLFLQKLTSIISFL